MNGKLDLRIFFQKIIFEKMVVFYTADLIKGDGSLKIFAVSKFNGIKYYLCKAYM